MVKCLVVTGVGGSVEFQELSHTAGPLRRANELALVTNIEIYIALQANSNSLRNPYRSPSSIVKQENLVVTL